MQSTTKDDHSIDGNRIKEYPALTALRLNDADLGELSRQGFIAEEKRRDRTYYKLRFRRNHKQVVRYIGSAECAAVVRAELDVLQAETAILRKLNSIAKKAGQMLRDAKIQLGPLFEANGLAFHGLAVRRPRKLTVDVSIAKS
jgi:hypothetical protein